VGATVGATVAAVGVTVGADVGDSTVVAPVPEDPAAAGGAVGSDQAVAGTSGSVAGGAGVAGTEVGTWVAGVSPPPQAARKREARMTAAMVSGAMKDFGSGNPERLTVQSMEPPATT